MSVITIRNSTVSATSPEGIKATMPLSNFAECIAPKLMDTGDFVLPDGGKGLRSKGSVSVLVHETPPHVASFKWIAHDSPVPFGPGTKYRVVKIALPYLLILAVYQTRRGITSLAKCSECFFANRPFSSYEEDMLCYPALLNCSRFEQADGHPLAWICCQHLNHKAYEGERDLNKRMRAACEELKRTLLETGFNYSSEHHEGASWFGETVKRKVHPAISSIEKWEAATRKDPCFAIHVPWLAVGLTVEQVIERIFKNLDARDPTVTSARNLEHHVFNHKSSS